LDVFKASRIKPLKSVVTSSFSPLYLQFQTLTNEGCGMSALYYTKISTPPFRSGDPVVNCAFEGCQDHSKEVDQYCYGKRLNLAAFTKYGGVV
jgi:hypothetical protein